MQKQNLKGRTSKTLFVRGEDFEEIEPGRILGGMTVNGAGFHAEAIRVRENAEGIQEFDGPDSLSSEGPGVLDNMFGYDQDGPFQTVRIDGFPGRWVLFITPHKD